MSRYRVILSENFVTVEQIEQPPITIERIGYNRYKVVLTASGRIFVLGDVSETGTGSVDINAAFQLAAELNEMGVGSAEITALFNVSGEVAEGGFGSVRVFSGQELEGLISEAGFGSVNIAAAFELAGDVLESGTGAVEITALFNVAGEANEAGVGSVKVFSGFELAGEANEAGVGSVVVEEDTPPGFDPDYQAVLDSVASTEHPSAGEQTVQNALMVAIKAELAAGGRTLADVDELYVYDGDGTAAFKARNWANPSQTCTFASGLTLTTGGAFGDGSNGNIQIPRRWDEGVFETGATAFYVHALRKINTPTIVEEFHTSAFFSNRNRLRMNTSSQITDNGIYQSGAIIPSATVTAVDKKVYAAWTPKDGVIVRARYAATNYDRVPANELNGGTEVLLYNNCTNGGLVFMKGGNASWAVVQELQKTIQDYAER
jgi:hypothetical protein